MRNGTVDVAYAIYTAEFKMAKKGGWGFSSFWYIPYPWKYEVEMPTPEQKGKLSQWCELQFYKKVHQTFGNGEF